MLTELDSMGGDTWFQLGDKDLATHIYRTFNLSKGKKLTEVTKDIKDSFGIKKIFIQCLMIQLVLLSRPKKISFHFKNIL